MTQIRGQGSEVSSERAGRSLTLSSSPFALSLVVLARAESDSVRQKVYYKLARLVVLALIKNRTIKQESERGEQCFEEQYLNHHSIYWQVAC
jgi:hypothetical protein